VHVGAFSVVESYGSPDGIAGSERYDDLLRLAESAERSGLTSFWVAEHHFQTNGVCPSPPVLLAAAGARTASIRLGSLVSVLPFHRPIDVAEEYALLDQLLHGRLNFGVGSGYVPLELEAFGVLPEEKRERFDRNLAEILAAFRGDLISPDGGTPVRLNVLPVQRPHPPVWVAVQQREALRSVARQGYSVALLPYASFRDLDDLAQSVRVYRSELPADSRGTVSVALPVHVGEDRTRGLRALTRHLDSRSATRGGFYQGAVRRGPTTISAEAVDRAGFAIFGPAHEVVERVEELGRMGIDELLGIFDFGDLPRGDVVQSMRTVGGIRTRIPDLSAARPVADPLRVA
jgi:alkanesulfonate monooxygenase SsuD/methylene tetrahydromethanopterin reductase-like flavin-dependent oxidoreductase (luciferase family)